MFRREDAKGANARKVTARFTRETRGYGDMIRNPLVRDRSWPDPLRITDYRSRLRGNSSFPAPGALSWKSACAPSAPLIFSRDSGFSPKSKEVYIRIK
jgi:hypothetical protein